MFTARIFTLYPDMFPGPLSEGLFGRALKKKNLGSAKSKY